MIGFLKKRSYDLVVLFINQIAISIFGMSLAFATEANNKTLLIVTSVASILFYLFLIYNKVWDIGYKDKHDRENDKAPSKLNGLYIGLGASIINIILAILITIGLTFTDSTVCVNIGFVAKAVSLLIEGMYIGILSLNIGGTPLNSMWFMYFIIVLPLIATTTVAYIMGNKEIKLFTRQKSQK